MAAMPGLPGTRGNGMTMRRLTERCWQRPARAIAAVALVAAGSGAGVIASAGAAGATACGGAIAAGSSCTLTGTATLTGGSLTLTSPTALGWSATLNGANQNLYDTTSGDETYTVDDATGSGTGWNVTVSATQFTTGSHTLANTGTLSTNGSLTSATATTAPASACATGSTCTLPSNTTTYPVAITTAASSPTAVKVFDDAASNGLGQITVSNIGWWVAVPANTLAGTYTSTFTFQISSGP
jgi:hypothetical protein